MQDSRLKMWFLVCGKGSICRMNGLLCMVWCMVLSSKILCALKWVFIFPVMLILHFKADFDGVFEFGFEYEVVYDNWSSVHNDIKGEYDLDIGDSTGWGGVVRYYSKGVELEGENCGRGVDAGVYSIDGNYSLSVTTK